LGGGLFQDGYLLAQAQITDIDVTARHCPGYRHRLSVSQWPGLRATADNSARG
jgi:hypothetical protein